MTSFMEAPPWPTVERLERFEERGDTTNLRYAADDVLVTSSLALGRTDVLRGRPVAAWGTAHYTCGVYHVHAVHTGALYRPIATLGGPYADLARKALHVHGDELRSDGAYTPHPGVKALSACQGNFARGPVLPLNMTAAMGRLHLAVGYAQGAQRIATYVKSQLHVRNGRFWWRYVENGRIEDIWHGALVASFVMDAWRASIVFDDTDIAHLRATYAWLRDGPRTHLEGARGGTPRATAGVEKWARAMRDVK
jgi:hypothetical protein